MIVPRLATEEELSVDEAELSDYITRQAEQIGVSPDRLARQLADSDQIAATLGEPCSPGSTSVPAIGSAG